MKDTVPDHRSKKVFLNEALYRIDKVAHKLGSPKLIGPKMSAYFYESKQTAGKMWMWDLENPTNGNGKNKGLVRDYPSHATQKPKPE